MRESGLSVETRGKARHDKVLKHNVKEEDHAAGAKRLKKARGEEVPKKARTTEENDDDDDRRNEAKEREQKSRKAKKERTEKEDEEIDQDSEEMQEEEHDFKTAEDFDEFLKELQRNASIEELKTFLQENNLDVSCKEEQIYQRSADALMFGACESCPLCGGVVEFAGHMYRCSGYISEWSRCNYSTRDNVGEGRKCRVPESLENDFIKKWVESHEPATRSLDSMDKPFLGMTLVLSGRMHRPHGDLKKDIEKYGGIVVNSIRPGVECLLSAEADIQGGGNSKTTEALANGIPICRDKWLDDSIEKMSPQPLQSYNMASEIKGVTNVDIPWDKQAPEEEAAVALMAEVKLVGKRGVYKDTELQEQGGKIFEKDGIIYNCAFSMCDITIDVNQYAILQLIEVPTESSSDVHLYFKEGRVGDNRRNEERLQVQESPETAVKEFVKLFAEVTGNDFEMWEREKKFVKKCQKFIPLDMASGVDARAGGLGVRQLGIGASHSQVDSRVVEFLKLLFSQTVYRFALSELGLDVPDLPVGILTDWHIDYCTRHLNEFADFLKKDEEDEQKKKRMCIDFSNKWFSVLHTTRPILIETMDQLAELGAATLESVRDISYASRLLGDMSGDTLDDPIADRYAKMKCRMTPLDREGDDYQMIVKYLRTTMEPLKYADGEYGVVVEDIVQLDSEAAPSLKEMEKMPNKFLLWCGTRTSNLIACLSRGNVPAIFDAPAIFGYSFGRGLYSTDAAAKASQYGFTAVNRPEGFLLLCIVSLGDEVIELPKPEKAVHEYERKGVSIKVVGQKAPDKEEYFKWKHDVTVPCGSLKDTNVEGALLDYNEFVVYDPKQVRPTFLVRTRFEPL